MYQIRYLDPITGAVLEAQSHALEEAVAAIKKAKDNLYFKGYASVQEEPMPSSVEESSTNSSNAEDKKTETEYETESPSIEDEDYWYPYGVTLW